MSETDVQAGATDITVIGCGLMGSALARQFARSGYHVAAWNRTFERADALSGDGVLPIRSVVDAVRSSALVVSCTSTYDTTRAALEAVDDWQGITLVNVANGTPGEADEFDRWVTARGARYLEGGIFCYPQDIGTAEAAIYYSGPAQVWSQHEHALMTLAGASHHVSDDITSANVMFVGISAFFMPAMTAYVEAATYLLSQGISVETLREITDPPLRTIAYTTEEAMAAITTGELQSDQATVEMYAETAQICLDAVQHDGYRARLLAACVENLKAAEAAGLGKLGFYAQTKVARVDDTAEARSHP